jgi:hypothetical protein
MPVPNVTVKDVSGRRLRLSYDAVFLCILYKLMVVMLLIFVLPSSKFMLFIMLSCFCNIYFVTKSFSFFFFDPIILQFGIDECYYHGIISSTSVLILLKKLF